MSQAALDLAERTPRPKQVTKRQMRLAALLPRCETAAEALRLAGYSPQTIDRNGGRQAGLVGVRRATEAIARVQADSARGLMSIGIKALGTADADLKELEPRERIAAGFKAVELAHNIGENIEQVGDGKTWRYLLRRAARLAYRLGYLAGQRGTTPPQDIVLSPPHNIAP